MYSPIVLNKKIKLFSRYDPPKHDKDSSNFIKENFSFIILLKSWTFKLRAVLSECFAYKKIFPMPIDILYLIPVYYTCINNHWLKTRKLKEHKMMNYAKYSCTKWYDVFLSSYAFSMMLRKAKWHLIKKLDLTFIASKRHSKLVLFVLAGRIITLGNWNGRYVEWLCEKIFSLVILSY